MHFEGEGRVYETLRDVTRRLNDAGIPYAVVGGMALFAHGYRRFTEDVDLLVTPEGLQAAHHELEGLGYVPPFTGSKQLKDVSRRTRVKFLVTGQYPGDGKPKPVAFPDPSQVSIEIEGIRYLNLPTLLTLKLASGMSSALRLRDLADVLEVIRVLKLPESFAEALDPYVRDKFGELWTTAQTPSDE